MMRVLFIDDDANVLDGLRRALRSMRGTWDMKFVSSGREALEAFTDALRLDRDYLARVGVLERWPTWRAAAATALQDEAA